MKGGRAGGPVGGTRRKRHPGNRTIITYDDGEQEKYGLFTDEEKPNEGHEV